MTSESAPGFFWKLITGIFTVRIELVFMLGGAPPGMTSLNGLLLTESIPSQGQVRFPNLTIFLLRWLVQSQRVDTISTKCSVCPWFGMLSSLMRINVWIEPTQVLR